MIDSLLFKSITVQGNAKLLCRLKNESENVWIAKKHKVTITPNCIFTIEEPTSKPSDVIIA